MRRLQKCKKKSTLIIYNIKICHVYIYRINKNFNACIDSLINSISGLLYLKSYIIKYLNNFLVVVVVIIISRFKTHLIKICRNINCNKRK
jgi:hypothetical protein